MGMILINTGPDTRMPTSTPCRPCTTSDRPPSTPGGTDLTATIAGLIAGLQAPPVPQIAGFSSRGPSNAVNSDLLKPDIAAPGVNVIAGVSPLDPNHPATSTA